MMCSEPRSAVSASGRSSPWVSEITPIRMELLSSGVRGLKSEVRLPSLPLHLLHELADADHRPADRAAANLLRVVAGGHAQGIEASIERFQHRLGLDPRADAAGGAVLNVDRRPHRDLIALAVGLQRMKRRRLHQPDHVRRRIHRRQLRMVRRKRVLELDRLFRLAARPNGDISGHSLTSSKKNEPTILAESLARSGLAPPEIRSPNYAVAIRRALIPSSAFHSIRAASSAASSAASAFSGRAAIRFSSCLRQTFEWCTSAVACSEK